MPARAWVRTRRTRWLDVRKATGRKRPLPVKVGEANCQGVTESAAVVRSNIRRASQHADLIFFSEVGNVRVALALGDGWHVHQGVADVKAGCAIALRKTRGRLANEELHFGNPAKHGRNGVGERWIPTARVVFDLPDHGVSPNAWSAQAAAYHAPPMRAWDLWPGYMRRLRALKVDLAGGDGNKLAGAVSAALSRKVRGSHVTGVAVRYWIPSSPVSTYDIGSDHRMSVTTLWPIP